MEKSELKKYCLTIVEEEDEREKELYLRELGDSIHNYIRTGVKNTQLDEMITLEEEFAKRYEERFDIKKIADKIAFSSRNWILEIESKEVEKKNHNLSLEKEFRNLLVEKVSEQITKTINDYLYSVLKDAAYLSHVNMLYELYAKEEKLRREEKEYEEVSKKFKKAKDVIQELGSQRRSELENLQYQVDISQEELINLLNSCKKYFNIRNRKESVQVSLSPAGKKYYTYIMNTRKNYSNEAYNQLLYKNCDNLLEAFEKSYDRGIEVIVHFEEINPERESALQSKYNRVMKKIVSENEEIYERKNYIKKKRVSVSRNNEENVFTISEKWDKEVF